MSHLARALRPAVAVLTVLSLAGCGLFGGGGGEVEPTGGSIDVFGSVYQIQGTDTAVVEGARVYYVFNNRVIDATVTDSTGYFRLNDVQTSLPTLEILADKEGVEGTAELGDFQNRPPGEYNTAIYLGQRETFQGYFYPAGGVGGQGRVRCCGGGQ